MYFAQNKCKTHIKVYSKIDFKELNSIQSGFNKGELLYALSQWLPVQVLLPRCTCNCLNRVKYTSTLGWLRFWKFLKSPAPKVSNCEAISKNHLICLYSSPRNPNIKHWTYPALYNCFRVRPELCYVWRCDIIRLCHMSCRGVRKLWYLHRYV